MRPVTSRWPQPAIQLPIAQEPEEILYTTASAAGNRQRATHIPISPFTPRDPPIWFNGCMDGKMRDAFRRRLFLLIGLLTLCLFFLVEGLDRAGKGETAHALAGPMRVLILPMYVVWMVITIAQVAIVGPVGLPGPFGAVLSGIILVAGLAPYAFADYLLDRWRRAAPRNVSTSDSPDALNARLDASRKEGDSEEHPAE